MTEVDSPSAIAEKGALCGSKLSIRYNDVTETLEVKWTGTVNSSEVRQAYSQIMECVKQYKPVKWLLDFQGRERLKRADQRWVFTYFFPGALREVKNDVFVAVVLPVSYSHELVQEMNGDELIQGENFMIINHFMYREAAMRWLALDESIKAGA